MAIRSILILGLCFLENMFFSAMIHLVELNQCQANPCLMKMQRVQIQARMF